jgi:hypothetical protein
MVCPSLLLLKIPTGKKTTLPTLVVGNASTATSATTAPSVLLVCVALLASTALIVVIVSDLAVVATVLMLTGVYLALTVKTSPMSVVPETKSAL